MRSDDGCLACEYQSLSRDSEAVADWLTAGKWADGAVHVQTQGDEGGMFVQKCLLVGVEFCSRHHLLPGVKVSKKESWGCL